MIVGFTKNVIAVLLLIVLVLGIAYAAACIIGNVQMVSGNEYNTPDADEARYWLKIRNTGNVLMTNNLERQGDILILDGYWELDKKGKKFKYKDSQLSLDQSIFGKIEVIDRA